MALSEEQVEEIGKLIDKKIEDACKPGGDVNSFFKEFKKKEHGIAGLLKHNANKLQPEKFESEAATNIQFKHWNEEFKAYIKVLEGSMMVLMNIAEKNIDVKITKTVVTNYIKDGMDQQINTGDMDKYFEKLFAENGSDGAKLLDDVYNNKDEEFHTLLMFSLGGEAKEIVRNAKPSGIEGWRALNFRWNRSTQYGSTQIAEMIGKIQPAKNADEVLRKDQPA